MRLRNEPGLGRPVALVTAETANEVIASVPAGATPLEPAMAPDPVPLVFGPVHTDSNMHVNSLVYVRVFEEAALRRFAALGKATTTLSRELEIGYRKPCFAGEKMRVATRAFMLDGRLGVSAVLVTDEEAKTRESLAGAKARTYVQLVFE